MSVFDYQKDADNIVTITMNMSGPVNAMNAEYFEAMHESVNKLEAESDLAGVVIASAKKVFFAGGDLNDLLAAKKQDIATLFEKGEAGTWVVVMKFVWRVITELRLTISLCK